jgi:pimeloyl-ACP methyl ester carboxylesterase
LIWHEFGKKDAPTVILLHGGGLSWWACAPAAKILAQQYHVILPVIAGHGEAAQQPFHSIEASAEELLRWADETCGGQIAAIAGLSLGAQIAAETLAQRPDFARYAVLESALVIPMPATTALMAPANRLCAGLVKKRWFAKAQADALYVPEQMFEAYFADSSRMTAETLVNITKSNGNYPLPEGIRRTKARVLIAAGEKELGVMTKSARLLHAAVPGSELYLAPGLRHGEWSLKHPQAYAERLEGFFAQPR